MTSAVFTRDLVTDDEARSLAEAPPPQVRELMARAAQVRDEAWGRRLTYSPKVFLPITNLCRNHCDYCAFRRSPGEAGEWTMGPAQIKSSLLAARRKGCVEALLCLGDTPEAAFRSYRGTLFSFGQNSTVDYLEWASRQALASSLLPHTNAGILSPAEMRRLKSVNVSLGLMLENVSRRLRQKHMPHHRAPDKQPERRLGMLHEAGRLRIPFTTGILIGIGETRRERVEALLAIRDAHLQYGHVQEVIVQNFTPHPGTRMSEHSEPSAEDMAHAVALARLILPLDVSVQAPPNLNAARTLLLIESGINDFGGISPLTPDYINPEKPWPNLVTLAESVAALGFELRPRLPIYESFLAKPGFLDESLVSAVRDARQRLCTEVPPFGTQPPSAVASADLDA